MKKLLLNAGRSTQSTLLGGNSVTLESLYLSEAFLNKSSSKGDVSDTLLRLDPQLQLVV